jgi:threonine synthase
VNELFGRPPRNATAAARADRRARRVGSAHADNAAPSLLGGFVLVRGHDPLDVIGLPVPAALRVAVVHPRLPRRNGAARALLRGHLSIEQAVATRAIWRAGDGPVPNDLELVGRASKTSFAEPRAAHSRICGRQGAARRGRARLLDLRVGAPLFALPTATSRRRASPPRCATFPGGRRLESEFRRTRERGRRVPWPRAHDPSAPGTAPSVTFKEALPAASRLMAASTSRRRSRPIGREKLAAWRGLPIGEVAVGVLSHLVGDEFDRGTLERLTRDAFDFPAPTVPIADGLSVLELFRADARLQGLRSAVLARVFGSLLTERGGRATILVATSGDTGSAVARGFHGVPRVRVVVLYPAGKVSPFQEAQMATLGGNVSAIRVPGTFDDCQRLVKQALLDEGLAGLGLSSANSINIGRLLPQSVYYVASWLATAGMRRARSSSRAEREPRQSGRGVCPTARGSVWPVHRRDERQCRARTTCGPGPTAPARRNDASNAMDVGDPSASASVADSLRGARRAARQHRRIAIGDETRRTIREVYRESGYLLDPHSAVGVAASGGR